MKAKELMIGDWVQHYNGDNVKIIAFYGYNADYMDKRLYTGCTLIKKLEPIPLTAEILEKNGFTCDANGMNDSDEPVVSVEYGEFQRNTDDGFKMLADSKSIKYVHELQHALKLCGIEKDIEL